MNDIQSEASPGIPWGFGSLLFEKAFADLAAGLARMFFGLLLQLAGGAVLIVGLALAAGQPRAAALAICLPIALVALGVGGLVVLWGEQTCLHLKLPLGMTKSLPGLMWLRAAYFCHLGSIFSRLARRWLPRGVGSLITMPLELLGFVFLLLFLRKIANILARRDLERLIQVIFGLGAVTALCAAVLAGGHSMRSEIPRQVLAPLVLGAGALAGVTFLAALAAYAMLLWRMAAAARDFSQFLASEPDMDLPAEEPALQSGPA